MCTVNLSQHPNHPTSQDDTGRDQRWSSLHWSMILSVCDFAYDWFWVMSCELTIPLMRQSLSGGIKSLIWPIFAFIWKKYPILSLRNDFDDEDHLWMIHPYNDNVILSTQISRVNSLPATQILVNISTFTFSDLQLFLQNK